MTEIPPFRDEAEEHVFWSNHEFGNELWEESEPLDEAELPQPRPLNESLLSLVTEEVRAAGFVVVDRTTLPERAPQFADPPQGLNPRLRTVLGRMFPRGLYSHQRRAIEAAIEGDDLCISTSTASGKSLVFVSIAVNRILRDQGKVLALYPARALIQDQLEKWRLFLDEFDLSCGFVDGGVRIEDRGAILRESNVVLMTPDVAHAWLMSSLQEPAIAQFLEALGLMILDEAHVYEGAFGTNMAYFLRRFQAVASPHQLICSTATLGQPADFTEMLTGRTMTTIGPEDETSASPRKEVLLVQPSKKTGQLPRLIATLADGRCGRFLAFVDSRIAVERIVSEVHALTGVTSSDQAADVPDATDDDLPDRAGLTFTGDKQVLPYRAGYESADREAIQRALTSGSLKGVVSTSALELGLDIGEIDLVLLTGVPPTMKALWQRIGRAGRLRTGVCVIIDPAGLVLSRSAGLGDYLSRPLEPSWLYLENRYLQYANALCAAYELASNSQTNEAVKHFNSLPAGFLRMLENELSPTEPIAPDLYPLKQRAQAGPHREFALRTATDPSFKVKSPFGLPMAELSLSQLLREGYPGAIYYYMGVPYRVARIRFRDQEIQVRRERRGVSTSPLVQAKVFPQFGSESFSLLSSPSGFLAETELQVSERVIGFLERRGSGNPSRQSYGPDSVWSQRELNRYFETTGVCWSFGQKYATQTALAHRVLAAFCEGYGVQERDLGVGTFYAKSSPVLLGPCEGISIFDATRGSLRLTQRLMENFTDVLQLAILNARNEEVPSVEEDLQNLLKLVSDLQRPAPQDIEPSTVDSDENWVPVIAQGQHAIWVGPDHSEEIVVSAYRYTPQGLVYDVEDANPKLRRTVFAQNVRPLHGETQFIRVNLLTGEVDESVGSVV